MRPTRAAVALFFVTIACGVLGRVFGAIELFFLAGICIATFIFSFLFLLLNRLNVAVTRVTSPAIIRTGTPAQIDLTLRNLNRLRTPVLQANDQIEDDRGASVLVAPIRKGNEAKIKYRLPTTKRGRVTVGPFDVLLSDPLGLGKSKIQAATANEVVVRPQIMELSPIKAVSGQQRGKLSSAHQLSVSGDEFLGLRPYVVGDELRRVHWAASAKTGELVVRQTEQTQTGSVTILFDRLKHRYDEEGFERAVTTTISSLYSAFSGENLLRFMTTDSPETKVSTPAELEAIDKELAFVTPSEEGSLLDLLTHFTKRSSGGGTLVLITGEADKEVEAAVGMAKKFFRRDLVVLCQPAKKPLPFKYICHDGTTDFALGWDLANKEA